MTRCGSDLTVLTDILNEYFALADPVCDDAGVDYVDYAVTSLKGGSDDPGMKD